MSPVEPPFASLVSAALRRKNISLRELCRRARLDPSFFSKVLAGKRSPPSEEEVLRRIAEALDLDPAELVVSAGRLPEEWQGVWKNPALFESVHELASGGRAPRPARRPPPAPVRRELPPPPSGLSEELL